MIIWPVLPSISSATRAAVGGISFSTNANNGLMVNANGYTQRLPQLFRALLDGYFSYTPTEEQLEQAKSPVCPDDGFCREG